MIGFELDDQVFLKMIEGRDASFAHGLNGKAKARTHGHSLFELRPNPNTNCGIELEKKKGDLAVPVLGLRFIEERTV